MEERTIWTDQELADEWKCDVRLVQRMYRRGEIEGFKVGRAIRVTDRAKRAHEAGQNQRKAS